MPGQLFMPVVVVRKGVAVNRLIFSAVDGEVCLAVAVQVEFAQSDGALDWLLEDSCHNRSAVPHDFAWQSGIHRNQLHLVAPSGFLSM